MLDFVLPYINCPRSLRTFAIERLLFDHSLALFNSPCFVSKVVGARIPVFTSGYPILPTKTSGGEGPEKCFFICGWFSMNLARILQGCPHKPLPLHLIHKLSICKLSVLVL